MSSIGKNVMRLTVAASAVAAMAVVAPSTPASAATTVCGAGYEFTDAKQLPSTTTRYATLFFYMKGNSACAILDNNTTGAKPMDLRIWPGDNKSAGDRDNGTFSQYAGPVYSSTEAVGGRCVGISAVMKNAAGTSNLVNWSGGYVFAVDTSTSECA